MGTLKIQLAGEQSTLNSLLEKAKALPTTSTKSKSPQVQAAIGEVLGAIEAIKNSHIMVSKAFKTSMRCAKELAGPCSLPSPSVQPMPRPKTVQTSCTGSQTDFPTHPAVKTGEPPNDTATGVSVRGNGGLNQSGRQLRKQPQLKSQRKQLQQREPRSKQPPQQQQLQKQPEQAQAQQQPEQQEQQGSWSEVVRRKKKGPTKTLPSPHQKRSPVIEKISLLRRRAPKTSAVTIDRPAEGGSLAAVMKRVSGAVNLGALGIKVVTTRRTKAGGILLEVEGEDNAKTLERHIKEVVGVAARIRRPVRKTPVLLLDVPE